MQYKPLLYKHDSYQWRFPPLEFKVVLWVFDLVPVFVHTFRPTTGLYNRFKVVKCKIGSFATNCVMNVSINLHFTFILCLMLCCCGDIEMNPGPTCNVLKICHIKIKKKKKEKKKEKRRGKK